MKKNSNNKAILVQDKVLVETRRLKDQLIQRGFGEQVKRKLVLDLWEALYLLDNGKIEVADTKGKEVDYDALLKYASKKDKRFYTKFTVYSDLRERGFVTKTGFKFGCDFRVYPRGKKPGEEHTYWTVYVLTQNDKFNMIEMSRMIRLSGNLKTMPLFAIVDSEDDMNYYEVKRITP